MFCWKRHAEDRFDDSKKKKKIQLVDEERSEGPKNFEDKELKDVLDKGPFQTLENLGKTLQVNELTLSKCLKALGMIQNEGYRRCMS